ncbi:MAG: hypothetical protein WAM14_04130 [Candidatus Nitrosopolaris sp.]
MSNSHSRNNETKDKRDKDSLGNEKFKSLSSRQATCKLCGLTARNEIELEDHARHAHKINNNNIHRKSS